MAPAAKEMAVKRPVPARTPAHLQQSLVHTGESHERQHLDADGDQQPPHIEVGQLGRGACELATLTAHGPEGEAAEREPDHVAG